MKKLLEVACASRKAWLTFSMVMILAAIALYCLLNYLISGLASDPTPLLGAVFTAVLAYAVLMRLYAISWSPWLNEFKPYIYIAACLLAAIFAFKTFFMLPWFLCISPVAWVIAFGSVAGVWVASGVRLAVSARGRIRIFGVFAAILGVGWLCCLVYAALSVMGYCRAEWWSP
jgi:hypothetical protein